MPESAAATVWATTATGMPSDSARWRRTRRKARAGVLAQTGVQTHDISRVTKRLSQLLGQASRPASSGP